MSEAQSLHARLRDATGPAHRRLEDELDWEARTATLAGYRDLLGRFRGFHAVYEPAIAVALDDPGLLAGRMRVELLDADLRVLGMDAASIAALPCPPRPGLANAAQALGALYVLEGSTLGGQVIGRSISRRLGAQAAGALAYYGGHGRETAARWRGFLEELESACAAPAAQDQAIATAIDTFDALRRWLVRAQAPLSRPAA